MTAPTRAMATGRRVPTIAKALDQALRRAEFDIAAADSAPFFFRARWLTAVRFQVRQVIWNASFRRIPFSRTIDPRGFYPAAEPRATW